MKYYMLLAFIIIIISFSFLYTKFGFRVGNEHDTIT